ncbi:MAG: hypothetical protein Q8P41_07360 [Pseudomonadota bacterium]|nr:hypothetical protein [Pseudomonadota bacterium]
MAWIELLEPPPAVTAERAAVEAEIVAVTDRLRAAPDPALALHLADLELARGLAATADLAAARRAWNACPRPCALPEPPMRDWKWAREAFGPAFRRYDALLERAPDTPGLDDAIVRITAAEVAGQYRADPDHLSRIDRWAEAYPDSDAPVAAWLLYYQQTFHVCATRRLRDEVATRLYDRDSTVVRVLALDARLDAAAELLGSMPRPDATGEPMAAALEHLAELRAGLDLAHAWVEHRAEACRWGDPEDCNAEWVAAEQARLTAAREAAVWVYAAALDAGAPYTGPVVTDLFAALLVLQRFDAAETLARRAEAAGARDIAMGVWQSLGWYYGADYAPYTPRPADAARAAVEAARLAEALGRGDVLITLAGGAMERGDSVRALALYRRALALCDSGGRCTSLYEQTPAGARRALLRGLAKAWRAEGGAADAERWFRSQGELRLWTEP